MRGAILTPAILGALKCAVGVSSGPVFRGCLCRRATSATCHSCAATLADRVHRFQDAGYCKECHEEAVEMTPDSEDE